MSGPDVRAEIQRGDLGRAKRRLASSAAHRYDAKLCSRIGDLCVEMKDPYEAGRWYFLGSETNEIIEELVAQFIAEFGDDANALASSLPKGARPYEVDEYPEIVRDRFALLGVVPRLRPTYEPTSLERAKWDLTAFVIACLLYGTLGFALFGIIAAVWLISKNF